MDKSKYLKCSEVNTTLNVQYEKEDSGVRRSYEIFPLFLNMIYCILRVILNLYTQVSSHFHSYLEFPQLHSIFPPPFWPRQNLQVLYIFWDFWTVTPSDTDQSAGTLEIIDPATAYVAINPKEGENLQTFCIKGQLSGKCCRFLNYACSFCRKGGNWLKAGLLQIQSNIHSLLAAPARGKLSVCQSKPLPSFLSAMQQRARPQSPFPSLKNLPPYCLINTQVSTLGTHENCLP